MMTRKDYVKTAEILQQFSDLLPSNSFEDLVFEFGEMFSVDNPNFDFRRFENACWLDQPVSV